MCVDECRPMLFVLKSLCRAYTMTAQAYVRGGAWANVRGGACMQPCNLREWYDLMVSPMYS